MRAAALAAKRPAPPSTPPGGALRGAHSMALTMSSTTFFASPNTIIVLSM